MESTLRVESLDVTFKTPFQNLNLISQVSFNILPHKTRVLLGESGSGKSLTALSILGLLPSNAFYSKTSRIFFEGRDLLNLSEAQLRKIRGGQIAMIFQEPTTSLNPVLTIGEQVSESVRLHQGLRGRVCQREVLRLFDAVKLSDPERMLQAYPHQLSGGMKQRVMIAMALAGKPQLLIADEPTTALDVTTQADILKLLKELQVELGMSMLFITHDLTVAAIMADEISVLKSGKMVEQGDAKTLLSDPKHPYTQQLLSSFAQLERYPVSENNETVLSIHHLKVYFPVTRGFWKRTIGQVQAVDDVSFSIKEGETLALVGESGCGKTTLAKTILSLIKPTFGEINLLGEPLGSLSKHQLRCKRSDFQMIFQDPFSAMDPKMQIRDILEEGLLALNIGTDANERQDRMDIMLKEVGLLPEHKYRYPHEFSGGQRQRICIARALVLGPRLLVCDEPTSSLDMPIQASIIDLLIRLQHEYEISYLFITHNLSIVKKIAHRVAVMKSGKIVEHGPTESVLNDPKDPYTQSLLLASNISYLN